jgi:hypothetical protein
MARLQDDDFDFRTIVAPEFLAEPPLKPEHDAGQPLWVTVFTVTTTTIRADSLGILDSCIRYLMITREPLNLVSPTTLREIFHSADAQFSSQRFDRADERQATFTLAQLQTFKNFTIEFLKVYDSHRSIEERQRNSECLSALDTHPLRYLIAPLGPPQAGEEQHDEDEVDALLGGWVGFAGDEPPVVGASPEVIGAWLFDRLDDEAVTALLFGSRFAASSDR